MDNSSWKSILSRLEWITQLAEKQGWPEYNLQIKPPIDEYGIELIEDRIGYKINPQLAEIFIQNASELKFGWRFPDNRVLPKPFHNIFGNQCETIWSIFDYQSSNNDWDYFQYNWLKDLDEEVYKEESPKVSGKAPLLWCPNGDRIVIDRKDGFVSYIDHECGDMHGKILSKSVNEFFLRWCNLYCPGPEYWQLLPFYNSDHEELTNDETKILEWQRLLES